jgi:flavin reductase (DIM6/NTAB) family NADH-FMN oxidoreductase RutF
MGRAKGIASYAWRHGTKSFQIRRVLSRGGLCLDRELSENPILDMTNDHFVKCCTADMCLDNTRAPRRRSVQVMLDRPMLDARELRNAFGVLPTGVAVVSLKDEAGKPTGVTVGSFTSLSLSPALCLFSLGKSQASARLFQEGVAFFDNVWPHQLADVAWQFAKPAEDKCAGVALSDTAVDAPRLRDAIAHFACHAHAIHEGGDHIIVVGEIIDFDHGEGEALVFYRGAMHKPALV